ncbi:MAG: ubiquinol-cytochrome c reductase iron-sulfur subunit [Ignavibacteria bacterium]|nr:ubiquinol-cytochrome c reductase iron-sulfur subunit [Ignavibacteria bacterium]
MHNTTQYNRRTFLAQCSTLLVGSITTLPLLSSCALNSFVTYTTKSFDKKISLDISRFPELNEIGNAIEFDVENIAQEIIVTKKSETEYLALSPVCSHLGCTVRKENSFFHCGCHGSTFSLDGNVMRGPAERPLTSFRTEFHNNYLTIFL